MCPNRTAKRFKIFGKEISKLLSEGLISDAQFKELESITLTVNPDIKLNQFLTLYNLKESGVKLSVNKLLLIYKYFTLSKEDDIKKVYNSNFQSRKDDYVLQNFILIDYLVNKKIAQVWKYESTNDNDIFTLSVKTISNIDDYNKITQKIFDVKKIATKDVLFSKNEFEATLGGYKGIETTSLSFDYSLNALKENTSDTILSGFYDFNNNKLVKVNSDKTLAQAISVLPEGNKINITYLNRLAPIGKSFQIDNPNTKEKTKNPKITVKKLTLENTYFSSNLLKLIVALSQNDNNLYTLATEAFVNLGNKITLKVDDPNLKKALEGLKYVG
ncbi:HinT-interacting membrane complex lipoprotein P60 [Mycoplasmopsis cynos]|uniref:HinT-interacting membrane complex lipoprotein P60 n=1 Tax=Mycoplasmopsis cynos TaxID=171284 RepID=UPI003A5C8181